MKDLRDSFASWLLTVGVNPAWVSKALGHATWAVTANHYAARIGDGYREPMALAPGEVPPDLLARLSEKSPGRALDPPPVLETRNPPIRFGSGGLKVVAGEGFEPPTSGL